MSLSWSFIFGVILIIIWIIAGIYVTQANIYLTSFKDTDESLHQAYWLTFWAAFVTWTLVGIFVVLVVLSVLGIEEIEVADVTSTYNQYQQPGTSWASIIFLFIALVLIGTTGVLSALAATAVTESSNFNQKNDKLNSAYQDCIIGAVVCLTSGGLLILGIIAYFVYNYRSRREAAAKQIAISQEEQKVLINIQEIREENLEQQYEKEMREHESLSKEEGQYKKIQ
jgi:hypothetical protein